MWVLYLWSIILVIYLLSLWSWLSKLMNCSLTDLKQGRQKMGSSYLTRLVHAKLEDLHLGKQFNPHPSPPDTDDL